MVFYMYFGMLLIMLDVPSRIKTETFCFVLLFGDECFLPCMTDLFRWSFTYTLTEAAGLLENLSLDSQTKTAGNPAPATKVSWNLDSWFFRIPYVTLFDSIVNWWYSLPLVTMDQVTWLLIQPSSTTVYNASSCRPKCVPFSLMDICWLHIMEARCVLSILPYIF
jgi:hypothetical protein